MGCSEAYKKNHTRRLKNYLLEKTKVSCEFFHFMKFQGNISMFPENYAQPGRFAYNNFIEHSGQRS